MWFHPPSPLPVQELENTHCFRPAWPASEADASRAHVFQIPKYGSCATCLCKVMAPWRSPIICYLEMKLFVTFINVTACFMA